MRTKRLLAACAAFATCVFNMAQAAPQDPGPSKPVHVTNPVSNPVPVTGTVEIGGTPSVTIDGVASPLPVVEQENPDRLPYAQAASVTLSPPFVNAFLNFPTPAGRRYFIEQASMTCITPSATDVFTQAQLTVLKVVSPSQTQAFGSPVVTLEPRGPAFSGGIVWTGSANVKVISDASPFNSDGSGALFFNIFHSDSTVTAQCHATLFGHSVPL